MQQNLSGPNSSRIQSSGYSDENVYVRRVLAPVNQKAFSINQYSSMAPINQIW